MTIELYLDSKSAILFTDRRGPGLLKHADIKLIGLQEDALAGHLKAYHVPTSLMLANTLTKPVTITELQNFCVRVGIVSGETQIVMIPHSADGYEDGDDDRE